MKKIEMLMALRRKFEHYISMAKSVATEGDCDAYYYRICGAISFARDIGVIPTDIYDMLLTQAADVCAMRALEVEYGE